MSGLGARLLDASGTLDAADRALLDIWTSRGLDDAALARMTGMSEETIANRRSRIVEHLSVASGLSPEDVRSGLTQIRAGPPATNGTAPDAPPTHQPPASERKRASASRRRRRLWSGLAVLLLAVVAVVLIASQGSGGPGHHRASAAAPTQHVPTVASSSAATPPASHPAAQTLVALPLGPDHATGTVSIGGSGRHLTLDLSVSGLPAAQSHGHYEVWLYDSIINAEALGQLRTGVSHVSLQLPGNANQYHWIDISFQPLGHVFHSGESLLRSSNPLFGRPAPSP